MRRVRYSVAASLDGYIAGPRGEYDWIPADPEIDFAAMYARTHALLMGRVSYEVFLATGGTNGAPLPTYVYSRALPEGERDGATFVRDPVPHVRALREGDAGDGKELWCWGGGQLFATLAAAELIDVVEVAVIPIVLGGGVPLVPSPGPRLPLRLVGDRVYRGSGIVVLTYDVARA